MTHINLEFSNTTLQFGRDHLKNYLPNTPLMYNLTETKPNSFTQPNAYITSTVDLSKDAAIYYQLDSYFLNLNEAQRQKALNFASQSDDKTLQQAAQYHQNSAALRPLVTAIEISQSGDIANYSTLNLKIVAAQHNQAQPEPVVIEQPPLNNVIQARIKMKVVHSNFSTTRRGRSPRN